MNKCKGTTQHGTRCKFYGKYNGYCNHHKKRPKKKSVVSKKSNISKCKGTTNRGTRCKRYGTYDGHCNYHKVTNQEFNVVETNSEIIITDVTPQIETNSEIIITDEPPQIETNSEIIITDETHQIETNSEIIITDEPSQIETRSEIIITDEPPQIETRSEILGIERIEDLLIMLRSFDREMRIQSQNKVIKPFYKNLDHLTTTMMDMDIIGTHNYFNFSINKSQESENCCVCLLQMSECLQLPCGHRIHKKCFSNYLSYNYINCPICRGDMFGDCGHYVENYSKMCDTYNIYKEDNNNEMLIMRKSELDLIKKFIHKLKSSFD